MRRRSQLEGLLVVLGLLVVGGLFAAAKIAVDGPGATARLDRKAWELSRNNGLNTNTRQAEALARRALDRAPLDGMAGAIIALAKDKRGETDQAKALMLATAKVTRRSDLVDTWLFDHLMADKAYPQGLLHIDAFLRRHPEVAAEVTPLIIPFLSDEAAINAVAQRLAKDPIWRPFLVGTAITRTRDPTAAYLLFDAMTKAGSKPKPSEMASYLNRLVAAKRFEEAYLAWFLSMPEGRMKQYANIYDPGFDDLESMPPFAWQVGGSTIGRIESALAFGRPGSALHIDYRAPTDKAQVRQLIALTPGAYILSGDMLTGNFETAANLGLVIVCADDDRILGSAAFSDTGRTWKKFSLIIQTPEDGCKAQWLAFHPKPSPLPAAVDAWFDNLALTSIPAPASPAPQTRPAA